MGGGMSQVLGGLYLGNIRDSEDKETLTKNGITHILSVHNNAEPRLEKVKVVEFCTLHHPTGELQAELDKDQKAALEKIGAQAQKLLSIDEDMFALTGPHKNY